MVLVRLVFSISICLLSLSCISYNKSIEWETNSLHIDDNNVSTNKEEFYYSKNNSKPINRVITNGSISNLTLIGSDLWIGKLGGEILRYNIFTQDTAKILDNKYSIIDYSIKGVVAYNDFIFILQSTRLIRFNRLNEKIEIMDLPEEIRRASSLEVNKEKLYIGTLGTGIWEYHISNREYRFISDELLYISSLLLVKNELIIGSMDNGLYVYDLNDDKYKSRLFFPFALFRKNILCITNLQNEIWIGTAKNGLIIWNRDTNKVDRRFEGETISSITHYANTSAISIMDEGVVYYNDGDELLFSIDNGLLTHNITSLILYENRIISGNIKKGVIDQELQQF